VCHAATSKRGQQQQQPPQQQLPPVPFQEEPNPLMSTMGALSNIMGPRVAAAAAQTSLQALAEHDLSAGAVLNPEVRLAAVLEAAKQGGVAAANGEAENNQGSGDAGRGEDTTQQQQQQQGDPDPKQPISPELVASAVAAGIAAAATRAQQLATAEEREIQRLMVGLVHDAAKRLDAKVNLLMQLMDPPVSRAATVVGVSKQSNFSAGSW
jgi:SWI/SNF related-matrix-associated actin-dependent regulator of chromatin subfamily C